MANPRVSKPVLHTRKHLARLERERQQTRLILIGFVAILASVTGLILYAVFFPKYIQPHLTIAQVGDVKLTIGEWQARVRLERRSLINQLQLYQQYSQYGLDLSSQIQQITSELQSPRTLGQSVLDKMVDEELIRRESAKRGVSAGAQEVDAAIQASYGFYPAGTPTPTITPTAVSLPTLSSESLALVTITPTPTLVLPPTASATATADLLASPTATVSPTATSTVGPTPTAEPTATPYTQQGFEDAYKTNVQQLEKIGLTEMQLRQLYEANVLQDKLLDVITADVPRAQEEVWARHILAADEATANAVRKRLASGEDFGKVAAEVSTDTGTKNRGGDLGWFGRGAMVPEFETAAFSLKVGEISEPLKSQYGYHIIQVLAHSNVPLDASAYGQAKQTAFNNWLKQARIEYKVQTYDNWQRIVPADPGLSAAAP